MRRWRVRHLRWRRCQDRGRKDLVSSTGARPLAGCLIRVGAIPGPRFVVPEGPARAVLERYRAATASSSSGSFAEGEDETVAVAFGKA